MFKVEKGIKKHERRLKYPLKDMEIGDSFLIPNEVLTTATRQNISTCARNIGIKITAQKWDEGLRIWRIA